MEQLLPTICPIYQLPTLELDHRTGRAVTAVRAAYAVTAPRAGNCTALQLGIAATPGSSRNWDSWALEDFCLEESAVQHIETCKMMWVPPKNGLLLPRVEFIGKGCGEIWASYWEACRGKPQNWSRAQRQLTRMPSITNSPEWFPRPLRAGSNVWWPNVSTISNKKKNSLATLHNRA